MPYGQQNIAQYNNQQIKLEKTLVAGTYAEEQILLPQMPEGILPGFLRVTVQWGKGLYLDAAGDYLGWHISPKQQSDVIGIGDPDCICGMIKESKAVGVENEILQMEFEFPAPQLVTYRSLWFGAKATHAQVLSVAIHYVPRNASGLVQRDNLVSQAQF